MEPPKDTIKNKKKKREDASNYTQQEEKVVTEKVESFKNLNSVSKFKEGTLFHLCNLPQRLA